MLTVKSKVEANVIFNPAGASPALLRSDFPGITLGHPATGNYTVVLPVDLKLPDDVEIFVSMALASQADSQINLGPYNSSTRTINVYTLTAGANADIATGAVIRVKIEWPEFKSTR